MSSLIISYVYMYINLLILAHYQSGNHDSLTQELIWLSPNYFLCLHVIYSANSDAVGLLKISAQESIPS